MLLARATIEGSSVHGEVDGSSFFPLLGDVYDAPVRSGRSYPLEGLELESPIVPGRIFVIRGGFLTPEMPTLPDGATPKFLGKFASSVGGHGSMIVRPRIMSGPIAFEPELAVVLGKRLSVASPHEATDAFLGYTVFNDATSWDLVEAGDSFVAKSIDSFATMGPWIRTDLSESQIADGLAIVARVDGVEVVRGNTNRFKFSPSDVVSYLSQFVSLLPGDVIALGTPWYAEVLPGQEAELEVEGVGVLRNGVTDVSD
jgi:2-keto-4-pentenoate hydratase/2-oxohepta-3-ene-1,7-dioic acid hydratase in catechol pathway